MSSFNGGQARKRLSLFAGGSLAAASIFGAGVVFAPAAALAANECGDPGANGATADAFACTGTVPSISYSTNGALTLTLTNGPTVTTGGIAITGNGANAVTINRSDAVVGGGDPQIANTGGAGIQATTGTGVLTLTLTDGDLTGDTPISITGATAGLQLQSGATSGFGIDVTTTNGSISATAANGVGVLATEVGGGNLRLSLGGSVSGATGVQATTSGAGAILLQFSNVSSTVLGGDVVGTNGPAVRLTPGGVGNVTVGTGRTVRASNNGGAVIEITNVNATRNTAINNNGVIRSNDDTEAGYDDLAILVGGGAGNSTVNNGTTALLQGRVSLLNTGTATIANGNGVWHTVGVNTVGGAGSAGVLSTAFGNAGRGTIFTNASGAATSFTFGDGTDTFNNAGALAVGDGSEAAATLSLTGLDIWNNSGVVLFGVNDILYIGPDRPVESDGVANDRIVAHGAAFAGTTTGFASTLTSSSFVMDVNFAADQADCSAAVTADCLDLRDGGVSGSTAIKVNRAGDGFAERIVLVEAPGAGASTASAFSISPESADYVEAGGAGALETGMFLYTLDFDATAKQYALTALQFSGKSLEIARYGRAAAEPWRTATGMWRDRQAELRDTVADLGDGLSPGMWLKLAGSFISETSFQTSAAGVEYDTSAEQDTVALVGGVDLVRGAGEDSAWVLGLTAGKLDSTLDYDAASSELDLEGYSIGAYASLIVGRLFVDTIINHASMDLTHNDFGQTFETSATSVGYQVESGYQMFQFDEAGAYIEPVAALSYVKTEIDDLMVGPVTSRFDKAASLRAALGVRVAGAVSMENLTTQFSFTGRVWKEVGDDNSTTFNATYANAVLTDAAPETLTDLGVAIGLFTLGDRLSANIGYGVKFADDYQATDASISFRYQW